MSSRKRNPGEARSFPVMIALLSLVLFLWLYYSGTAAAAQERDDLQQLHRELTTMRELQEQSIAALGAGLGFDRGYAGAGSSPSSRPDGWDLQSLFVAIDQRGYTPAELAAAFPVAADDRDAWLPPRSAAERRGAAAGNRNRRDVR